MQFLLTGEDIFELCCKCVHFHRMGNEHPDGKLSNRNAGIYTEKLLLQVKALDFGRVGEFGNTFCTSCRSSIINNSNLEQVSD